MSDDVDAIQALADFRRFPTWMWRNTEVVEFVEWLRARNDAPPLSAMKGETPMNSALEWKGKERLVRVAAGPVTLEGARGVVLFAHGSGSSRHSPRNRL